MVLCLKVYLSFFVDQHKFFKMTRKIFQILGGCAHVRINDNDNKKNFHTRLRREKKLYIIIDKTENVQSMSSSTFFGIERRFLAMNGDHLSSERAGWRMTLPTYDSLFKNLVIIFDTVFRLSKFASKTLDGNLHEKTRILCPIICHWRVICV